MASPPRTTTLEVIGWADHKEPGMHRRGLAAIGTAGLLLLWPATAVAQDAEPGTESSAEQDVAAEPAAEVGVGAAASVETRDSSVQQEPDEDQVGIGEATSIECRGTVAVTVTDLDGATIGGAVLSVANQQVIGSGAVDAACGEVGATLLAAPDGYAPAGPTSKSVPVRQGQTSQVTFTVDPVQVLGTQFEQPAQEQAAPDTQVQASSAQPEQAAAELPATGPEDAPTLLLVALLCGLFGTVLVAGAPALARPSQHG